MIFTRSKMKFFTLLFLSIFLSSPVIFSQEIDSGFGNNPKTEEGIGNIGQSKISNPKDILNSTKNYSNKQTTKKKNSTVKVAKNNGYHFGVWINYQQQFGAIDKDFITIGGPSFGFNLGKNFLIGAGVYSTFGSLQFDNHANEHSFVYGGGIIGFRWNPQHPVVFRTQALIGAIAFDVLSTEAPGTIESRHTSLIVVPEIALDIRLAGYLFLTLSASYKYVASLPDQWNALQGLGALTGNASLGFSF